MINNRQGGRRRGRGGQRPPGVTGRPDGNRQDNRQRGNAAQLLEKYKAMARDSQLAGDRVQTEYYLQFADHYFRVLGESRARFEEQRRQRGDGGDDDDGDDDQLDAIDDDRGSYNQQRQFDRDDEAEQPGPAPRSDERAARSSERDERAPRGGERNEGRGTSVSQPRRQQRPDPEERISLEVIPPSIGGDRSDQAEGDSEGAEQAPKPRRRTRRPRNDDDGEGMAPAA